MEILHEIQGTCHEVINDNGTCCISINSMNVDKITIRELFGEMIVKIHYIDNERIVKLVLKKEQVLTFLNNFINSL